MADGTPPDTEEKKGTPPASEEKKPAAPAAESAPQAQPAAPKPEAAKEPQAPPAAQQQLPEQDAKARVGEALNVAARALIQAGQIIDQFPSLLTPESATIVKQATLALADVAGEIDGQQTPAAEGTVAPEASPAAPDQSAAPGATPPPSGPSAAAQ